MTVLLIQAARFSEHELRRVPAEDLDLGAVGVTGKSQSDVGVAKDLVPPVAWIMRKKNPEAVCSFHSLSEVSHIYGSETLGRRVLVIDSEDPHIGTVL